ncbi:DUF3465 domain-containing protein [uncultured Pseudoteredinibacter sp.]|uniref:DUF3465 domain-containing protein n=1 Tax=uncultured Pseudoteredinibacter sp. TaxID=1641701 RepID=UPI0026253CC3|nr:DUF3465 domain-containing protein [uncultured Pseudoteredinibacter sp.]MCV6622499.1 DUF3465 domain-containing protein [Cellvibrionaceae bacterium]
MNQNRFWKQAFSLVLILLVYGLYQFSLKQNALSVDGDDLASLQQAVQAKRSKVWFNETRFTVYKLLPDDTKGSQHQRFLVRREGLPNLLVAHNIDLAPRAPLRAGQTLFIKGRYEWNKKGGVIHWTHHDPRGVQPGGWLRVGEDKYQ